MKTTLLDRELNNINERVAALGRHKTVAYFACCAERLRPLYDEFVTKEQWGDSRVMRNVLDLVWAALERGEEAHWGLQLERVEQNTPHGEDFESVDTNFAQEFCGFLSVALMALDGTVEEGAALNAVEVMRVAACLEQTGYLDLGSGPAGERFEELLITDGRVQKELALQLEDLSQLEQQACMDYRALRERAIHNAWSRVLLLPTGARTDPHLN